MKEYTQITIETILFGFGIYSILFLIGRPLLSESKKSFFDKIDNSACIVSAIIGVLYLVGMLSNTLFEYLSIEDPVERYLMNDRLLGKYWIGYWIQPSLFLFSQLLWFRKIRKIKFIRFIIAILMITSIESIVVYLTSLHRDYLPSSWSMSISARITHWLISLGLFGTTTTIFHLIKTKLKVYNMR